MLFPPNLVGLGLALGQERQSSGSPNVQAAAENRSRGPLQARGGPREGWMLDLAGGRLHKSGTAGDLVGFRSPRGQPCRDAF